MTYKSITHSLDNISELQKRDLELAQTLSNNINLIKPINFNKVDLEYNGKSFYPITGFLNQFLVDDIHLATEGDIEKHKSFITNTILESFKDYDFGNKSKISFENLKLEVTSILKYYGLNSDITYPLYSTNIEFQNFINEVGELVDKELLKL